MGNFFEGLEHTWLVMKIAETGWLYATVSVTHYFTLFVLVGTIVLVDLRILGVAARRPKCHSSWGNTVSVDVDCSGPGPPVGVPHVHDRWRGTIIRTASFESK